MHEQIATPLVSIIMPTYNRAGYIVETIRCIQAQTYTNWELLIIDDGSADNTEELVEQMPDPRIKFYRFDRTGVTGKLKNFGIREAKGALIAFMDSDDLLPADKLEKQVNAMLAHPEAGFSYTNGHNFLEDKSIETIFYTQQAGIECKHIFVPYCQSKINIFIQSVMVWKYAIDRADMFEETRLFNDFTFIGNLAWHYPAVVLYEQLFFRRLHATNSIHFDWLSLCEEYFELLQRYKHEKKLSSGIVKKAIFIPYINVGEGCAIHHKKGLALLYFFKAWQAKPYSIIPFKKAVKLFYNGYLPTPANKNG
jgi:glycosyltransferase involved in cell wall biosynthesis